MSVFYRIIQYETHTQRGGTVMPEMIPVKSSNIEAIGYDHENNDLHIKFIGGKTYIYEKVVLSVYDELMTAESVGKYFSAYIKNKYVTRMIP
jgi:hypothetical protein